VSGTRRGRGWAAVAGLALAATAFSVVNAGLLLFTPLALLLLTQSPRRPWLVGLGAFLLVISFTGRGEDPLWYFERGWVLVLGAWFVIAVVFWPRASFISRALGAVGATVLTAALLLASRQGGFSTLDWWIAERLRSGASEMAALWSSGVGFERVAQQLADSAHRVAELQVMLYPALLALASLAALGVAWWAYGRLVDPTTEPLGRLREFRFDDALVWLLIAGVMVLLMPLDAGGTRFGTNVLVFMGALYVLRGIAVLVAIAGAMTGLAMFAAAVLLLLLYPLVLTAAAIVGLSDTWLDIRARRDAAAGRGT
jgi:hypothetical protein